MSVANTLAAETVVPGAKEGWSRDQMPKHLTCTKGKDQSSN